jgi:tellurite resistance protein
VAGADGVITQEGAQGLFTALYRMKLFKGTNDGQMKAMFDRVLTTLKKQGAGALIAAAKETLTPEQKETAFAIAADLILADGVVEDEEKKIPGRPPESPRDQGRPGGEDRRSPGHQEPGLKSC